jgi:predicted MPP superfamily phosphohydrolase
MLESDKMILLISGIFILSSLCLAYMFWEAKNLYIRRQELYLPKWPIGFNGIKILFLTDIHRRTIPHSVRAELAREKIDLVILGGDITEKGVPMGRVAENCQFLSSLGPVYFVWGNHDYKVNYRELDILLRELKVHVLDNRAVSFESGDDRLWLVGVDDITVNRDNLKLALAEIESPGYRLLLSHNPSIVEKLTELEQIQGVLSGHTHGGQICLPFTGPIYSGKESVVTKYNSGEYLLYNGKTKLFVSKGVGTSKLPLRLLAPPELHILTMKS